MGVPIFGLFSIHFFMQLVPLLPFGNLPVSSCVILQLDCNSNAQLPLWKLDLVSPPAMVQEGSRHSAQRQPVRPSLWGLSVLCEWGNQCGVVCCMADYNCQPVRLPLVFVQSSCLLEDWIICW